MPTTADARSALPRYRASASSIGSWGPWPRTVSTTDSSSHAQAASTSPTPSNHGRANTPAQNAAANAAGDSISAGRTFTAKPRVAAGSSIPVPSSDGAGSAELTSAPKPRVATGGAGLAVQTSAAKSGKPAGRSIPGRSAGGGRSVGRTAAAKPIKSSGRSIPAEVKREVWRRDLAAAPTSTGTPGGAAARASSWRSTTSFRSRGAAVRSRKT